MLAQFPNASFNPDLTHKPLPQVWIQQHFQFQLAGLRKVEHCGAEHRWNRISNTASLQPLQAC